MEERLMPFYNHLIKNIQLTTDENFFLGRPRSHSDHTFVGHTLCGQEVCVIQVEKYKNVAFLATQNPSRASVAIEQLVLRASHVRVWNTTKLLILKFKFSC